MSKSPIRKTATSLFLLLFSCSLFSPFVSIIGAELDEVVPTELILLVRKTEVLVFDGVRGTWVSERIFSGERVIEKKADGNVAIVVTNNRVLGYSAKRNFWASKNLIAGESIVSMEAKDNVGTVITDLRALGFSARQGQWSETSLSLK